VDRFRAIEYTEFALHREVSIQKLHKNGLQRVSAKPRRRTASLLSNRVLPRNRPCDKSCAFIPEAIDKGGILGQPIRLARRPLFPVTAAGYARLVGRGEPYQGVGSIALRKHRQTLNVFARLGRRGAVEV
jgi:hypothetical protein